MTQTVNTRRCKKCDRNLAIDYFSSYGSLGYRRWACRQCRAAEARRRYVAMSHTDDRRRAVLAKYSLTPQDYDDLFNRQHGQCAICGEPGQSGKWQGLHVDHNHTTGQVRGLLCKHCNVGLGIFGDDPDRLITALEYLEQTEVHHR